MTSRMSLSGISSVYGMIRAFAPLLGARGRLLIVASSFGSLRHLSAPLHSRFDSDGLSLDDLDAIMAGYVDAVESGRAAGEGWPEWINVPSKVGQVAAMRVLAREQRKLAKRDGRFIAAVCPGLVDKDASRPWFDDMAEAQSPDVAAEDVLALALDQVDSTFHGEVIQHRRIIPWSCEARVRRRGAAS